MLENINEKYKWLIEYLRSLDSVVIAFSGGTDSAFLLKAAKEALGDRVVAVIIRALSFPQGELDAAVRYCVEEGIAYEEKMLDVFGIEGFRNNTVNRCYICKTQMLRLIRETADRHGISSIADGSNVDDMSDYRPGMKAAREQNILSPLAKGGFSKQEIRQMSHILELETWDKPSYACLATRFVYGEEITPQLLEMVEQSEAFMFAMGFRQVRIRVHGRRDYIARIEVQEEELARLFESELRSKISNRFRKLGFSYVTADIQGYRTGSMNETNKSIKKQHKINE